MKPHGGTEWKVESLWLECKHCHEIIYEREYLTGWRVCPKCDFHDYLPVEDRIRAIFDTDSFQELDARVSCEDPLQFVDIKPYKDRLLGYKKRTGRLSAVLSGWGMIDGINVQSAILDFSFAGGSLGSAEGEKITRVIERGIEHRMPLVIFSASGGARMQESILALMQMAKTSAAIARAGRYGIPFISVLTNPTSGGVTASFAMLGDINIAEPGALICFAGPRVIKQTIGEDLPAGFQRAEFLLAHGMVDIVCHRSQLKKKIAKILELTTRHLS